MCNTNLKATMDDYAMMLNSRTEIFVGKWWHLCVDATETNQKCVVRGIN